jgi:hypothetical protein
MLIESLKISVQGRPIWKLNSFYLFGEGGLCILRRVHIFW